jgi:ketosteroid isomerase-like protein
MQIWRLGGDMFFASVSHIVEGLKIALAASQPPAQTVFRSGRHSKVQETKMTIATDLLQRHIQTLVDDSAEWQTLIADDISWELAYAPSIGHPARLSGRAEAVSHATWFLGAVENFRFFDLKLYALVDPQGAVAEVKAEGLIKSTGRMYRQDYVLFLRAADGKIAFLREYFDPSVRPGTGHTDSGLQSYEVSWAEDSNEPTHGLVDRRQPAGFSGTSGRP